MSFTSNTKAGIWIKMLIFFNILSPLFCDAQLKTIKTLHQQTKLVKSEQNDFDSHFGE
jgi:hypothetical protein